jgi:hypothetical protein
VDVFESQSDFSAISCNLAVRFVVDEEDRFPGLSIDSNIKIVSVLDQDVIGYGSRQVGGGKGPKNPHGEESELLYYVSQEALQEVEIVVKPGLLIDW